MPPRWIAMLVIQFNLEYLTTYGSIQKGNPTNTLVHFLIFSKLLSVFLLDNLFFTLKVTVVNVLWCPT